MIPGCMAGETYAWVVVHGIIAENSRDPEWRKGNYNANSVFYQTISPDLVAALFYDNTENVKVPTT